MPPLEEEKRVTIQLACGKGNLVIDFNLFLDLRCGQWKLSFALGFEFWEMTIQYIIMISSGAVTEEYICSFSLLYDKILRSSGDYKETQNTNKTNLQKLLFCSIHKPVIKAFECSEMASLGQQKICSTTPHFFKIILEDTSRDHKLVIVPLFLSTTLLLLVIASMHVLLLVDLILD